MRTPVSYKCGWGSVKANPHPNQLEPSGKIYGCGSGAENQSPPMTSGHCLGFAPRSQNLTFGAELLSVRFARYPDYLTNVHVVRPQIRFPRKGGRRSRAQLALNRIPVILSQTAI